MITLKDGSQGFQREDGKFDVFQFSSNGKFSGMKTVTGQLQNPHVKKEDTSASTEGSSATEKHLKILMKTQQKHWRRSSATSVRSAVTSRNIAAKMHDDSDEDISDEEI